jgi:parallel beta-helix repeat protein
MTYPETLPPANRAAGNPDPASDHNILTTAVQNIDTRLHSVETGALGTSGVTQVYTVAASDSSAFDKAIAQFVCDGTNDHLEIQSAIDAAALDSLAGGEVRLMQGTYHVAATISLSRPDTATMPRIHLNFAKGARILNTGVTGTTALIKVESSDSIITNAWLVGSGAKGNGYGIVLGGDTATFGGRWSQTVYRCRIEGGVYENLSAGIVIGIDTAGTSSSGDNLILHPYITHCKDGIYSLGFVNRLIGGLIGDCNYLVRGGTQRGSHAITVSDCTLNDWAIAAVSLPRDKGSIFRDCDFEHSDATITPTRAFELGDGTNVAYNTRFEGTTWVHLAGEQDVFNVTTAHNVHVDNLLVATTGAMPTRSVFRGETSFTGRLECNKVIVGNGSMPAGWSYSLLTSNVGTGKFICHAVPGPAGSAANTVHGSFTPTPTTATYWIDVTGTPNNATYWAKDRDGHIAGLYADTATVSGLKTLIEGLQGNGVHFFFGRNARYHCLDDVAGIGSGQDHLQFTKCSGLEFSGSDMYGTILSNLSNYTGASYDTEPMSFTNCDFVTIRNMTVESCGCYNGSTDCIDLDQGRYCLIDRVRVTRSRARAIIFDGGDFGKWSGRNVVRNCLIQGCPPAPEVSQVTGGTLTASIVYRYVVSWVCAHGSAANTPFETKPSGETQLETSATSKQADVELPIGPYDCTARKVYRSTVGSPTWVLIATVNDNTTTTFRDTGAAGTAAGTMPVANESTIFDAGIAFLASSGNEVVGNVIDGVGAVTIGSTVAAGIDFAEKHTGVPSATIQGARVCNDNRIHDNHVVRAKGQGIRVRSGSRNIVHDNRINNIGVAASKTYGIYFDGSTDITSDSNVALGNVVEDNRDANSAGGDKGLQAIGRATGTAVNSQFLDNIGVGWANTTGPISDVAVGTYVRHVYGVLTAKTAAYTVNPNDDVVPVDTTAAARVITLPTAVGRTPKPVTIKKLTAANTVTITPNGTETIDGATTLVLTAQWSLARLIPFAGNWITV